MSRKKKAVKISAPVPAPVPVFVFLDENVSHGPISKLKNAHVSTKYQLKIIPFPPQMRFLAIFDFQVVLFLKKVILSREYSLRRILYNNPKPVFVFITGDGGFIGAAEEGFAIWAGMGKSKEKRHRKETVKNLRFYPDAITIKLDNNYFIYIHVRFIPGGGNDTQQITIRKTTEALEKFLTSD